MEKGWAQCHSVSCLQFSLILTKRNNVYFRKNQTGGGWMGKIHKSVFNLNLKSYLYCEGS